MQSSATIIILHPSGVEVLTDNGELLHCDYNKARTLLQEIKTPLVIHAQSLFKALDIKPIANYDLLELFAFVHPARFCVPTASGLGHCLGIETKGAASVPLLVEDLLETLRTKTDHLGVYLGLAQNLQKSKWGWADLVLEALHANPSTAHAPTLENSFEVWKLLEDWHESGGNFPSYDKAVTREASDQRLTELLGAGAEIRQGQHDYCAAVSQVFTPKQDESGPNLILAEGGTGIGKTFGYLAPATLWAEMNQAPVWVSTFTRNLQHQIYGAMEQHYGKEEASNRTVIRKGRENYLCLENYAQHIRSAGWQNELPLALMALWILHSRDGDLNGDTFPSWLQDIVGRAIVAELPDKRGECIYSACFHYRRCFIESSIRKARSANVVVANHALIIESFRRIQRQVDEAKKGETSQNEFILRAVFDEGHNLFHCADSAFSAQLSGATLSDLRRWLIGAGGNRPTSSIAKGLESRLHGLLEPTSQEILQQVLHVAALLPVGDWFKGQADILLNEGDSGSAVFNFLGAIYQLVDARADKRSNPNSYYNDEYTSRFYSEEETLKDKLLSSLLRHAKDLHGDLQFLLDNLRLLYRDLNLKMEMSGTSSEDKARLRGCLSSLQARALEPVEAWSQMLDDLTNFEKSKEQNVTMFSWFQITRQRGLLRDIGLHRHQIDPMEDFSDLVLRNLHGGVITSATLTDDATSVDGWDRAYRHSGAAYFKSSSSHHRVISPFNYREQSAVLIVTDLGSRCFSERASAFSDLFCASGGGGLGIFTSIKALRSTQPIIRRRLMEQHISLYAQHTDGYHLADLVQIFKHEEDSCLIGTDAVRDGVDIPGRALRLVVFDKVPWPQRSLLLRARVGIFGESYNEMLCRLALRQAFGRLIRKESDRGLFVMLDNRLPRRMLSAFPSGVGVHRLGLSEAVEYVRDFTNE